MTRVEPFRSRVFAVRPVFWSRVAKSGSGYASLITVRALVQPVGRGLQTVQHLRDSGAAYSKEPSESCPAFELAGVKQGLVVVGEAERIAGRLTDFDLLLFACD